MKLLLDTHTLLWLVDGDAQLTQPARNALADPANELFISVATIWELAIAEVFFRRGFIEKWGRGTLSIVEMCRAGGYAEPEFVEQAGTVTVRFPLGTYVPPAKVSHDLTERQRRILSILSDGRRWRLRDILEKLEDRPAERTLRDDLQFLKQAGMVDSGGKSVAARWWLVFNR